MSRKTQRTTAGYHIDTYKKYGMIPAVLLAKINSMLNPKNGKAKDFCWISFEDFERETGFGRTSLHNAIKKLVEAGEIEHKVCSSPYHQRPAHRFSKVSASEHYEECCNVQTVKRKISADERYDPCSIPKRPMNIYVNPEGLDCTESAPTSSSLIRDESSADADAPSLNRTPDNCPTTSSSDSAKASSSDSSKFIKEEQFSIDESSPKENDPFSADVTANVPAKRLSLKPEKESRVVENRKAAVVVKELMAICGVNGVVDSKKIKHIRGLLGTYSVDQLKQIAEWTKTNDFYKDKSFMARFSHDACEAGLMKTSKQYSIDEEQNQGFSQIIY